MIEIYIGMFSGGWARDGVTQGWSPHTDPSRALDFWAGEIEERHASRWRKVRAVLWLSGGLARPYLCGPIAGLTSWREADAFARAAAPEATGLDGPCRVQLEDWPGATPTLGVAIDLSLAESIEALACSRRIVWRSVRPRWASAFEEALAQRPSVAIVAFSEEDALTLLAGQAMVANVESKSKSGFDLASTYSPPPAETQAISLWHRMILSRDVSSDDAWFARLEPVAAQDNTDVAKTHGISAVWPGARHCEEVAP